MSTNPKPSPVLSKEWIEEARTHWWPLNAGSYHTVPDTEMMMILDSHETLRTRVTELEAKNHGLAHIIANELTALRKACEEVYNARIESLNQQLKAKTDELEEYRENVRRDAWERDTYN